MYWYKGRNVVKVGHHGGDGPLKVPLRWHRPLSVLLDIALSLVSDLILLRNALVEQWSSNSRLRSSIAERLRVDLFA